MNARKMTSMGLAGAAAIAVALFTGASTAVAETSPRRSAVRGQQAVPIRMRFRRPDRQGGFAHVQPRIEEHLDRFEVRAQFGYDDPRRRFQRYERSLRWSPVSELSAQVVVTDTVVHSEELVKLLRQEGSSRVG